MKVTAVGCQRHRKYKLSFSIRTGELFVKIPAKIMTIVNVIFQCSVQAGQQRWPGKTVPSAYLFLILTGPSHDRKTLRTQL